MRFQILFIFVLAGCAASDRPSFTRYQQTLAAPSASMGRLYIYRPKSEHQWTISARIRIDETPTAEVGNGEFSIVDVAAGHHDFKVDNACVVPLEVTAGSEYFVELRGMPPPSPFAQAVPYGMQFGATGALIAGALDYLTRKDDAQVPSEDPRPATCHGVFGVDAVTQDVAFPKIRPLTKSIELIKD